MQVLFASARFMLALAVAVGLSLGLGAAAKAETEVAAMGGVIDVTNRLLTVVMPEGNVMVIEVGPDVQHIEKIKVEDKITVTYSEEVATSLQRLADQQGQFDHACGGVRHEHECSDPRRAELGRGDAERR